MGHGDALVSDGIDIRVSRAVLDGLHEHYAAWWEATPGIQGRDDPAASGVIDDKALVVFAILYASARWQHVGEEAAAARRRLS